MKFWSILNASDGLGSAGWAGAAAGDVRGKGKAKAEGTSFALSGEELGSGGVIEFDDWASSGEGDVESARGGVVVQVLVRKLQGGANKGMSRSLEALVPRGAGLVACPWNEVDGLRDVGRTYVSSGVEPEKESQEVCSFGARSNFADGKNRTTRRSNTSRSTSPSRRRNRHPVHKFQYRTRMKVSISRSCCDQMLIDFLGDDASSTVPQGGIIFEPGSEDDMDDDDPDEDLDF
jgi:hypothetical protein